MFRDESISLQPSTSYQYRVIALGPADATGKRLTYESIVAAMTPPRQTLVVGAQMGSSATAGRYVQLSWQTPSAGTKNILITSSYGARTDAYIVSGSYAGLNNGVRFYGPPRGTHAFAVTPLYASGTPAATTTVSVIVP